VASASEALAQGSTEQASAIEEITASIDDVAEKTKQNASQANVAADMMAKTIAEAERALPCTAVFTLLIMEMPSSTSPARMIQRI
jgi:hypothetical protein